MTYKRTLYGIASLILFFVPSVSYAQSCSVWFDANPINAGQGTTLHWSWSDPVDRNSYDDFSINNVGDVSPFYAPAQSGSVWVAPGGTTDYSGTLSETHYYLCAFWGCPSPYPPSPPLATCPATLTVIQDPCPTGIESYWGAGNYLLWASATRRINAVGINVCARNNNSGAHYFVPGRTYGELQSFINAASRLGVPIF